MTTAFSGFYLFRYLGEELIPRNERLPLSLFSTGGHIEQYNMGGVVVRVAQQTPHALTVQLASGAMRRITSHYRGSFDQST